MVNEKKMWDKVATFIKSERLRVNITQQELSDKADVSLRSVASIENGEKVRMNTLDAVLNALGYDSELKMEFKPKQKDA